MRQQKQLEDYTTLKDGSFTSSDHLYMNGAEIFSFTQKMVPTLVDAILSINKFNKSAIDLFVFHQANKFMLDFLQRKAKIDKQKFFHCLSRFGNTVSSTIPIALAEAIQQDRINYGHKILLAGFGVGYSWGGTILEINETLGL